MLIKRFDLVKRERKTQQFILGSDGSVRLFTETRQNRNKDTFQKQLFKFSFIGQFSAPKLLYRGRKFNSVLQLWP